MSSTHVLLHAPNEGYYCVCKAATNKHFSLEDEGYKEVASGGYEEMHELLEERMVMESGDLIILRCHENFSIIVTTQECLDIMLESDPEYLENKSFI